MKMMTNMNDTISISITVTIIIPDLKVKLKNNLD